MNSRRKICRGFYDAHAGRSPALILLRAFRRLIEVPPPEAAAGHRPDEARRAARRGEPGGAPGRHGPG